MACGCRKYKIKSTQPEHQKLLQDCVPRHDYNHMLSIIETIIIKKVLCLVWKGLRTSDITSSDITVFFSFYYYFFWKGGREYPMVLGGGEYPKTSTPSGGLQ